MCMSWRQPASIKTAVNMMITFTSDIHVRNFIRLQLFKKRPGLHGVEFRIRRFDAQEEAILAGEGEPRHVENRMVWLRQAVEADHADDGGQRGEKHGQLKGDWNPRGPAVQRTAADVYRIRNYR